LAGAAGCSLAGVAEIVFGAGSGEHAHNAAHAMAKAVHEK
jgi:hypothetical protein